MDGADVAVATNIPVGVTIPPPLTLPGMPPPAVLNSGSTHNSDLLVTAATATADPAIWLVTVPGPLVPYSGVSFAVVARDGSGAHDFAAGLASPRWDEVGSAGCGIAYWGSPAFTDGYICPRDAVHPGIPPTPGTLVSSPPTPTPALTLPAKVRLHGRRLALALTVPAAGTLTLRVASRAGVRLASRTAHVRHSGGLSITLRIAGHRAIPRTLRVSARLARPHAAALTASRSVSAR
jgi:hypothetical protein